MCKCMLASPHSYVAPGQTLSTHFQRLKYSSLRFYSLSAAMTSTVQCKYYVSGACTKGASCAFSHSFSALANTVLTRLNRRPCCV
jgi:hypothetical protein